MTMLMTALPLLTLAIAMPGSAPAVAPDTPTPPDGAVETLAEQQQQCRRQIATVRAERGLPPLAERDAEPAGREPILIAAVDLQIDGCPVLVLHRDPNDIRAVPPPGDRRASLLPAH